MRSFDLDWQGWCETEQLPSRAGIYCVWSGPVQKKPDGSSVISNKDAKLLYIGESGDIRDRVTGHNKWPCWRRERQRQSDSIVFTYVLLPTAEVNESWRKAVENCLIATHRPPCNDQDLDYHYDLTVVIKNQGVTFGKLKASHRCKGSDDPGDR